MAAAKVWKLPELTSQLKEDWSSLCAEPCCRVMKKREDGPLTCSLVQKQHTHRERLFYRLTLSKCHLKSKLRPNDCLLLISA